MSKPPPSRRLLPWLLAALTLGYIALGISRVRFEVDITQLLPENLPEARGARGFMRHFLPPAEVMLLLEGEDAAATEQAAARVAEALAAQPGLVKRVTWQRADENTAAWTELAAWALLSQPAQSWQKLEARLAEDQVETTLEDYVETLAASPFLQDGLAGYDPLGLVAPLLDTLGGAGGNASEFASADGRLRVVYADLATATSDYRAADQQLKALRETAAAAAGAGVRLSLTGEPAFLAEISLSMERDMKHSALTTLLLTTLLVWLVFRRLRLLPLLALCLGLTFLLTLATCGLLTGSLTALTVGFGSILIGLSADYGVLVFQARLRQGGDARAAARQARPGVLWAMATTMAVFLALLPLGFPGLTDLGLLVACGVVIGALVMLLLLPRLLDRWAALPAEPRQTGSQANHWAWRAGSVLALALLLGCAAGLLVRGLPRVDASSGSIRPRDSEAYAAVERLESALGGGANNGSLLVEAARPEAMAAQLTAVRAALESLRNEGAIASFALPEALWPDPERRAAALQGPVRRLLEAEPRLRHAVEGAGFTEEALALSAGIFAHWRAWIATSAPLLPENQDANWLVRRLVSVQPDGACALLGMVKLAEHTELADLRERLPEDCHPTGGGALASAMDHYLNQGFKGISLLFAAVTLLLLGAALRAWRPWLLVTFCLGVSYAALLGLMSWLDLSWNAFTLPALLLSLGTGSDYFIHLILRLQTGEPAASARGALAPALVVCAGSSVLGFGSLLTASSSGLASMGLVCAAALALNLVSALLLMPWLWQRLQLGKPAATPA